MGELLGPGSEGRPSRLLSGGGLRIPEAERREVTLGKRAYPEGYWDPPKGAGAKAGGPGDEWCQARHSAIVL